MTLMTNEQILNEVSKLQNTIAEVVALPAEYGIDASTDQHTLACVAIIEAKIATLKMRME